MTWTWQRIEEIFEGFLPGIREIATNQYGVSIEPWGVHGGNRRILFKYNDKDIAIEFAAHQSPKCISEYGKANEIKLPFPLGPICEVWIDDRRMKFGGRPLSPEEKEKIKKNISDLLTTAFHNSRYAAPPYAEQVEFY